jgi:hypothetical protein
MSKIVNNYGAVHSSGGAWAGKKQYPDLKKFRLKDTITLQKIKENKFYLPNEDMTKEQIKEYALKISEVIYV